MAHLLPILRTAPSTTHSRSWRCCPLLVSVPCHEVGAGVSWNIPDGTGGPATGAAASSPIDNDFKAVTEVQSPPEGDERRMAVQDIEHEAAVQHDELRRRLAADGNGAAADALRVQAAGFEDACDFKEVRLRPCGSVLAPGCRLDGQLMDYESCELNRRARVKACSGVRGFVQAFALTILKRD